MDVITPQIIGILWVSPFNIYPPRWDFFDICVLIWELERTKSWPRWPAACEWIGPETWNQSNSLHNITMADSLECSEERRQLKRSSVFKNITRYLFALHNVFFSLEIIMSTLTDFHAIFITKKSCSVQREGSQWHQYKAWNMILILTTCRAST